MSHIFQLFLGKSGPKNSGQVVLRKGFGHFALGKPCAGKNFGKGGSFVYFPPKAGVCDVIFHSKTRSLGLGKLYVVLSVTRSRNIIARFDLVLSLHNVLTRRKKKDGTSR
jgi:hypothetical protein